MFYMVAVGVFFLDRITKLLIVNKMYLGESIPVIKNIFHLTYIVNKGAAFGIFPKGNFFFIILSFVGIGIVISLHRKLDRKESFLDLPLGFILGGILGNLFDRLVRREVIDFLDFRIWPVFNFADTFICIGVFVIFLFLFLRRERQKI